MILLQILCQKRIEIQEQFEYEYTLQYDENKIYIEYFFIVELYVKILYFYSLFSLNVTYLFHQFGKIYQAGLSFNIIFKL